MGVDKTNIRKVRCDDLPDVSADVDWRALGPVSSFRWAIRFGVALSVALLEENQGQHRKAQDKQLHLPARRRTTEDNVG